MADELLRSEINIIGNKAFTVTNFRRIIEYTDTKLLIETPRQLLRIEGDSFLAEYISEGELSVKGRIISIEFLKGSGE